MGCKAWRKGWSWVVQRLSRLLFALAGSIFAVATASAQSAWDIEGSAGALWRSDLGYSTTIFSSLYDDGFLFRNPGGPIPHAGPGTNTDVFGPGPVFNLGVGYRLPHGFRAEVESGYAHYVLTNISPLNANPLVLPKLIGTRLNLMSGGEHDQYSATLNVFYDFPGVGRLVPFIGGGAGGEYLTAETGIFAGPGVLRFTQLGGHATDPLLLAEGGVTFKANANRSVVPSYRFEAALPANGPSLNAHIFEIGVRFSPASAVTAPALVHN
jgi:opacity protein-like surface antigen